MASTRNNNTPGDYYLQQKSYKNVFDYNQYKYSQFGKAYKNAIPCFGITPSHMPREVFSQNSVDIESALFGINASNLINPEKPVVPYLTQLPSISYFEKLPTFMPEPLIVEKNQRPFPK